MRGCFTLEYSFMAEAAQHLRSAAEVVRMNPVAQAVNGLCYAKFGDTALADTDLERIVAAVPQTISAALTKKAYYFVPLTAADGEDTVVAEHYSVEASDRASCHRNYNVGGSQCVFISTRLMQDKFSIAFEFFINVGHAFVEHAGVSQDFADLVWAQALKNVRGESSIDAWDARRRATTDPANIDERAKTEFLSAAFSDAIAVYLLSLTVDFDYYDLRERDYSLLAPQALAERLRKIAEIFPPNPGYEFAIYYRRR